MEDFKRCSIDDARTQTLCYCATIINQIVDPSQMFAIQRQVNNRVFVLDNDCVCKFYKGSLYGCPNESLITRVKFYSSNPD